MGTGRLVPTSRWRPLSGGWGLQLYLGVGLHQDPEGRGRVTGHWASTLKASSSWTSSTQSSSLSAETCAQPRSGGRVWAGSCCTMSWSGPAWTTSMPSATCWSPRAVSTCAPRYGRTTENSCYWLLNFPYVGVHPAVAQLLRPGGGGGHRADRQGECGGVSPEHLNKISK